MNWLTHASYGSPAILIVHRDDLVAFEPYRFTLGDTMLPTPLKNYAIGDEIRYCSPHSETWQPGIVDRRVERRGESFTLVLLVAPLLVEIPDPRTVMTEAQFQKRERDRHAKADEDAKLIAELRATLAEAGNVNARRELLVVEQTKIIKALQDQAKPGQIPFIRELLEEALSVLK